MKIASVFAAMPGDHKGLMAVKKVITTTLTELGEQPQEINLAYNSLPYYDGIKAEYMDSVSAVLQNADGVVFYTTSYFGQSGAVLQTVFEHLSFERYAGVLEHKNCFIVTYSDDAYGKTGMDSVSFAVNALGAYDSIRLFCDNYFCENLGEGSEFSGYVEKQTEDFYRLIRGARKFYMPKAILGANANPGNAQFIPREAAQNTVATQEPMDVKTGPSDREVMEVMSKLSLDDFSSAQEQDIEEITKFFASRFKEDVEIPLAAEMETILPNLPKKVKKPNLKQHTGALIHYFKPGQAEGLQVKAALTISGDDGFNGYFTINGVDCEFFEGTVENADVTIIAADKYWREIISGKISAQKAFMIGQIKVRGNFVLLTKLDQIFDFNQNI